MQKETITLLTIDDETGLRHGIRDYFEDSGYKVLEAENGRIGLKIFQEKQPDVVLVDLRMPEVDGLEVIKTITQEAPNTPVIVVSGTGVLDDAIEAMRFGAWDYVTKPISDMLILEHIVGRVLERASLLAENNRYQHDLENMVARKTSALHSSMQKLAERGDAFEHLAKGLISSNGEDVYLNIIKSCAAIFKTESAMLCLLTSDNQVTTREIMVDNETYPQMRFGLKGSPCEEVIVNGHCLCQQGVSLAFPEALMLQKLSTEGYIGVALKSRKGGVLGILAVFSSHPIELPDHAKDVLDIVAVRVSALIEQEQADESKRELQDRLQQAQKMEAIGTLAGGIAHDFNNILAVIFGYTEIAKLGRPGEKGYQDNLEQVLLAANRAKDLVKQILSFSRSSMVDPIPTKIQPIIRDTLKMLRSSLPTTIKITENIIPKSGIILADPTQVQQILMNLCTNSYHAMAESSGEIVVSLAAIRIGAHEHEISLKINPGEYLELTVSDTGSGISSDIIEKIFDPYFTTKEIGKGTGLGLSIIHGIMAGYGGAITVESECGRGSTFHAYFPVIDQKPPPEKYDIATIPKGNERILFVDDEVLLGSMGKDILEKLGYLVVVCQSGLEALDIFKDCPDKFDLVITDQTMPGMTGTDLAKQMIEIRPNVPIILCTGFSSLVNEDSAKALGVKEFVLKPFTLGVIAKLIRKVLDT